MNKLVGLLAAIVLALVAVFDIAKEGQETFGFGPVLILLAFGLIMWVLLAKIMRQQTGRNSGLPIYLALWLHSFFEGALAAVSFHFGFKAGVVVSLALLIHILPEGLAIVAALRQAGYSYSYAIRTYAFSIGILLVSFDLFALALPQVSQVALTALSTIVGGAFIYLAVRITQRTFSN